MSVGEEEVLMVDCGRNMLGMIGLVHSLTWIGGGSAIYELSWWQPALTSDKASDFCSERRNPILPRVAELCPR